MAKTYVGYTDEDGNDGQYVISSFAKDTQNYGPKPNCFFVVVDPKFAHEIWSVFTRDMDTRYSTVLYCYLTVSLRATQTFKIPLTT